LSTKKGQLSIETMILYGLIALVALSTVAALIYFNVLDLGKYLPDTCDIGGSGDLKCEEMRVSAEGNIIELGVRNVAQKNIANLQITLDETARIHLRTVAVGTYTDSIPPGQIVKVTIQLVDGAVTNNGKILKDQIFEAKMYTQYMYSNGAITQEASGSMKVKTS
jgi:hypothetical protein